MTSEAINRLLLVNAPSNALVRNPFFRRIYLSFFVLVTLFVLLPIWTVIYLPKSNRPRASWTLERCLRVRWSRRLCGLVARCEIDYMGRDLSIDPPRQFGDPVLVHFHGGGYLFGTAAETDLTSSICKSLVKHSPIHHVLSVDYRLAPSGPWPVPLLDAISTYYHLVKAEHIPERDIVVGGDSAGGHLAMALVRWLRDEGVGIEDTFGPFACSLLLRALPASTIHTSCYLSPASKLLPSSPHGADSFEHFPPTYIVYGDAERLVTSIQILWSRLELSRQCEKATVPDRLFVGRDAVHDFTIFPWMAEEAALVYEDLDTWLRELLAADLEVDEEETPVSPEEAQSPDWKDIALQRRLSRRKTRESLISTKSPTMGPVTDESGVMRMVEDMREEGMSMIDVPAFDLDLSPFAAQREDGDYEWGDGQKPWYEIDGSGSDESSDETHEETRKDR
ncbi:hypothetical protein IAR55_004043 [Kwoniella newhampshirensis]|uniref:Alpha/beta hydrolase fold-3 domain-containing protein n=1 Tax=Kwoniella newhampshirensis TaxID=1651941 RepID=A0AAW0YXY5_9TREE